MLSSGSATIPLTDSVRAGDTINIIVANVTNPNSAGASQTSQWPPQVTPWRSTLPAYTIHANGSPGVVVTVNPNTTGSVATYTIANLRAHASLTAGTTTIQLVAPAGTVFPNNPAFFSISDSTSSSGSGTVSAALAGGGTSTVTFTVPKTINTGDAFSVTVADVLNPSTASSSDTIDIENVNVTRAHRRARHYHDDDKAHDHDDQAPREEATSAGHFRPRQQAGQRDQDGHARHQVPLHRRQLQRR